MKDWTGNKATTFATLAARNHAKESRQVHDYYATEPKAIELLLDLETFNKDIWECACGEGHLSKVLESANYNVKSTDLINRGYGEGGIDFLKCEEQFKGDITTNPPYKYAKEFVEKALSLVPVGNKVAMFVKLLFLESKSRQKLFRENPPKYIYVASSRLVCAKNGEFEKYPSSAVAYAWFIWEKGFKGEPAIRWFN